MKIIVNVAENYKPANKDMLVYNDKDKVWEVRNFDVICKDQNKKIVDLTNEVVQMRLKFANLSNKFDKVLDIVKEVVKND